MPVRDIAEFGDPILSIPCAAVSPYRIKDLEITDIVKDLRDTFNALCITEDNEDGIFGLAANQIGYNARIIIVPDPEKSTINLIVPKIIINPLVVSESGEKYDFWCGCASVGMDLFGCVEINSNIKIYGMDECGDYFVQEFLYFWAGILLHEIDHINGIFFFKKAKEFFSTNELVITTLRDTIKQ